MEFTTRLGLQSQTTRLFETASWSGQPGLDGVLTLSDVPFQGTWARVAAENGSLDYNSGLPCKPDFQVGLFPVHSPLLGESSLVSLPPLSNMLKFGG